MLRGCRRNPHRDRITFSSSFKIICGTTAFRHRTSLSPRRVSAVVKAAQHRWVMFHFVEGHHYHCDSCTRLGKTPIRARRCALTFAGCVLSAPQPEG